MKNLKVVKKIQWELNSNTGINSHNKKNFRKELKELINKHSKKNGSNTPDEVIANYLNRCLDTFDEAVIARERFYGRIEDNSETRKAESIVSNCNEKSVTESEAEEIHPSLELKQGESCWVCTNFGIAKGRIKSVVDDKETFQTQYQLYLDLDDGEVKEFDFYFTKEQLFGRKEDLLASLIE
jgi:hypothetical protein